MRLHVLLDRDHADVIEFYPSREAAEGELAEILHEEPGGRDGSVALLPNAQAVLGLLTILAGPRRVPAACALAKLLDRRELMPASELLLRGRPRP